MKYDFSNYTHDELIALLTAQHGQIDAWTNVIAMTRSHKRRADASTSAMEAMDMAYQIGHELELRAV